MNEIDFVILWVDGNDPAWREEFVRTRQAENDDASEIRYRDWRNLHYWFRSAERFFFFQCIGRVLFVDSGIELMVFAVVRVNSQLVVARIAERGTDYVA